MEDQELIRKYKHRDTKNYAFNLIVRKYQERVYWHIRKMVYLHEDADDLTQETFLKAWKNLDRFQEKSSLFTWLYRIATNEALQFLKKQKRRNFLSSTKQFPVKEQVINGFDISESQIEKKLHLALMTLPDKQRIVFNMRYFEDLKYEEISKILHTSEGALKASYHHAVKKIEVYMKNH